jgi:hypothetical protein
MPLAKSPPSSLASTSNLSSNRTSVAASRRILGPGEKLSIVIAIVASALIGVSQPALTKKVFKVKMRDDTTSLPSADRVKALSFGYHAATADLLWAGLLVSHGLHSTEHRTFPSCENYIRAIIELMPDHPLVYNYVDTLLVLAKPGAKPTEADARLAKELIKKGTQNRPYDHETWLHYGQYLAFLAPSVLTDVNEQEAWRTEGAYALARSVELGADADRSLSASTLLSKAGEKKAAIKQLQRAYAITDNPETRFQIVLKLHRYEASPDAEEVVQRVENEWRTRYSFLSRTGSLLIGPHRPPATCAGPHSYGLAKCASDWETATSVGR